MSEPTAPAIEFRGVTKAFGGTQALKRLDLRIEPGTIHALVGENGAGKSTCLGIAAGRIAASSGTVLIHGTQLRQANPRSSQKLGLAAIYQELTIIPMLTAKANVFLGQPASRMGMLAERSMRKRYNELCARLDVSVPADVLAGELSAAQQQLLEITRAIALDAQILLLDEPTSSLDETEREGLFRLLRELRSAGRTLVLVSHNLDEVLDLADTVTVFRDGQLVAQRPTREWSRTELVDAMLGEEKSDRIHGALTGKSAPANTGSAAGAPILSANITVPHRVHDVSVEAHAGEILGIAGLVGAGRTSLLRALAGLERHATGTCTIDGRQLPLPRNPRAALRAGIAMIPEDRKAQGLVLALPAAENIALSSLWQVSTAGFISNRKLKQATQKPGVAVGFDPGRMGATAASLSGGNQQKLLVARWRLVGPRVLLADEPTRGIDIGAKQEVLGALGEMAGEGRAVIVVSSEIEELIAICDRVMVLAQGHHVTTIARGPELNTTNLLRAAFHFKDQPIQDAAA